MHVQQITTVDTSSQRDPKGKLYYPSLRFGFKGYENINRAHPVLKTSSSKGSRIEAIEQACLWSWKHPGCMSLAYSRATCRVIAQFYREEIGLFGCLLYTTGGHLASAQNSHLFEMHGHVQPGRKNERPLFPILTQLGQGYLTNSLSQFHPVDQENWLAILLHEPILRHIIGYCERSDGGPPLDTLERWVQGTADLLRRATSLRNGHEPDPIKAFLEVAEALAIRSFGFDGVEVFGTHYQGNSFCTSLNNLLCQTRRQADASNQ